MKSKVDFDKVVCMPFLPRGVPTDRSPLFPIRRFKEGKDLGLADEFATDMLEVVSIMGQCYIRGEMPILHTKTPRPISRVLNSDVTPCERFTNHILRLSPTELSIPPWRPELDDDTIEHELVDLSERLAVPHVAHISPRSGPHANVFELLRVHGFLECAPRRLGSHTGIPVMSPISRGRNRYGNTLQYMLKVVAANQHRSLPLKIFTCDPCANRLRVRFCVLWRTHLLEAIVADIDAAFHDHAITYQQFCHQECAELRIIPDLRLMHGQCLLPPVGQRVITFEEVNSPHAGDNSYKGIKA